MKIAADMCIYTNDNFTIETIAVALPVPGAAGAGAAAHGTASYP
jgi:ATP-dependent HslUV protease subunit HslV